MVETNDASEGLAARVTIDPRFVRTFADHTFIMDLGRDMDVSFLAIAAEFQRVKRTPGEILNMGEMELEPGLSEVARVRMTPLCSVTLAMNILQAMIRNGHANKQAILDSLAEAIEPEGYQDSGSNTDHEQEVADDAF